MSKTKGLYGITSKPTPHKAYVETLIKEEEKENAESIIKDKHRLLRFAENIEIISMIEFLIIFFMGYMFRYTENKFEKGRTFYVDDGLGQCVPGRHRSFIDGYSTALTYFPDLSFKDWYNMLHDNIITPKLSNFAFHWCGDVDEYVFYGNIEYEGVGTFDNIDFKKYNIK